MAAGDVDVQVIQPSSTPCASFDGVDDNIAIADNIYQQGTMFSEGMTISAWIKPLSYGEIAGKILDKSTGTNGQDGWVFDIFSTNSVFRFGINNQVLRTSASSAITLGVWQHVMVTVSSANKINLYLNNSLSGSADQNANAFSGITTTNAATIGNRSGATDRTFNGFIRDVRMWSKALTSDERAKVYAGNPVTNNLIGHWKLNGNAVDSVAGNNGTVTGAVFINDCAKIDTAVTTQRSTVGSIAGTYLMCDVMNGTQVITTAIDQA